MSARFPGLRLRQGAAVARAVAEGDPPVRGRARREPAVGVGAPTRRSQELMAAWTAAARAESAPAPRARAASTRTARRPRAQRRVTGGFGALFLRAAWLQGVRAQSLSRLGQTQHREEVTIPAGRGTIFDRTGVRIALGERATTVYADPMQIQRPRRVASEVARVLGLDPDVVYPKLADRSRGFVYLARQADANRAAVLAREKVPGLGFLTDERRWYPQHSVGAQVLGYVGVDNNGLAGLEFELDHELAGTAGHQTLVKDPAGRVIDVLGDRPEVQGRDVTLTLDHTIQANAEEVLRQTVHKWGAKSATAIVLDPRTGAILAMAVQPGHDTNLFPSAPPDLPRNRTVTDTYEPG